MIFLAKYPTPMRIFELTIFNAYWWMTATSNCSILLESKSMLRSFLLFNMHVPSGKKTLEVNGLANKDYRKFGRKNSGNLKSICHLI